MDISKVTILVNDKTDVNDLPKYIVVKNSDIAEGYLHDTYDFLGNPLDEEKSSDYCLANACSAMSDDIKEYLVSEGIVDCSEDEIEIDCEGNVSINGEGKPGLKPYAIAYDEENREYTTAEYVNYQIGNRRLTLLLDCGIPGMSEFHKLGDLMSEDSTLASINNALRLLPGSIADPEVESVEVNGTATTLRTKSGVAVTTNPSRPWVAEVDF
jgi:hypothetical protein